MDVNELRELSLDRLGALEKGLRKQIFDARIKNYTNQLDDTASIRRLRRDLARVKTIQSQLISDELLAAMTNDDGSVDAGADVDAASDMDEDGVEAAEADDSVEEAD